MQAQARLAKTDPLAWLEMRDIYGPVGASEAFRAEFAKALGALWTVGTVKTLEAYLAAKPV